MRHGTQTFGLELYTRSLACFTELFDLFYVIGVKVVPEMIYDLLTPVALAHWIMCDGSARPSGLVLCTDSFTIQEVVLLMNVLI
ncbi:homing endonuclease, partial [Jimgerdemannia flammicorona]